MELTVDKCGNVTVLHLPCAALDLANAAAFREAIAPILARETKIVLDLGDLAFVDSTGLGVFLSCLRRLHAQGGDLKLCAVSTSVRTVLELVRMHRILDICHDRDEAIRRFA